eukprot:CAMPEP_0194368324 /NCGR_PEP_ID=MMETSP0174-20130528/16589_1 /TAXON_ID=216777 /ORGANISM="Proboscia alata, Strain PI-D3" /LENGTH=556 /DNA_ID=CAMNT_0039144665 /DNA_START=215 /DNA_END=1885 /DNA_ORIENTATION=+
MDSDGFLATVMYVGPVASAKNQEETYVGVAWDDTTRGKNDGSVICRKTNEIVRHFCCPRKNDITVTSTATGASFLRPHKIHLGHTLSPSLLLTKYVPPDDPELIAPNNILPHVASTSSGRDKPIEFLGEIKIRKQQEVGRNLEFCSLRCLCIRKGWRRSDDENNEVEREMFDKIKGVDLAGNLLCSWEEIKVILYQFPNLTSLSLASNRLKFLPPSIFTTKAEFARVSTLNLNDCDINSFKTILLLDSIMPNLVELSIAKNDFSDLGSNTTKLDILKGVTFLDLSDCCLSSWKSQVELFSTCAKLQTLILDNNPISSFDYDVNAELKGFQRLEALQMANSSLPSFSQIDTLSLRIPNLLHLRFRNAPCTSQLGKSEIRAVLIARMNSSLKYLNNSPITNKERIESERRYLRNVAQELLLMENEETKEQFLMDQHPKFNALMEIHREVMTSSNAANSGNMTGVGSLINETMNLTIISMAPSSCHLEPLHKRLPSSLKIERLKGMCCKAFDIEMEKQLLHFRSADDKNNPFPTELDDDEHTIGYYGVKDGDEIIMNET